MRTDKFVRCMFCTSSSNITSEFLLSMSLRTRWGHATSEPIDACLELHSMKWIAMHTDPGKATSEARLCLNCKTPRLQWCCAGEVGQTDFDQAILRAVAGVEKKRSVLQGAEKESVAKHECGHALVSTAVATLIPTSPQVSNASCLTCSSCQPCVAFAAFCSTGNVNCLIDSQDDCLCHHLGPM
jgi:hypothetical protein